MAHIKIALEQTLGDKQIKCELSSCDWVQIKVIFELSYVVHMEHK